MSARVYTLSCALFLSWTLFATAQLVDPRTPTNALPLTGGAYWTLAFSDEFNTNSLDTTKWGVDVSATSRGSRPERGVADWWWKSQNVSLDGSNLVLAVTKHDSNTMYCGSVSSDGLYEPTYGYMEARIQIADTTKDTHTAFWMQSDNQGNVDGTANDGAEIDIFESPYFADQASCSVHIDGYGTNHVAKGGSWSAPGIHSGYHTFGLDWSPNSMRVYYDGVLKYTYTGTWVVKTNEYLWLSDGCSFADVGTFTNEPIGFLTSAKFDYVRVWQTTNYPPVFLSDPVSRPTAFTGVTYSNSIAGTAADEDNDALTYSKVSGPAWLNILSDGTMTGTPISSNIGTNSWVVRVTDTKGASDTAPLQIIVMNPGDAATLVGGALLNGNFNANPGVSVTFAATEAWYNTKGDQLQVATRSDVTYDGSQNATLTSGRGFGVDTAYSLVAGDSFDFSYVWKDDWNWVDASDQVTFSLFITSDNTITGTRTNLLVDYSGFRKVNDAYEAIVRTNAYTASASVVGKRLFAAIEATSSGFARLDNIELKVRSYVGMANLNVLYQGNGSTGGSVPVDSTLYMSGATVTVLGNTGNLDRTGYTFSGWNTATNGSGMAYSADSTFNMPASNVTLYAQWTPYTVPMTLYDQSNVTGTGYEVTDTYTIYSGAGIPGGLDNQISSFVLEQGYMAVVAVQTNGLHPSKTYIASTGPLVVNTLPAELDNQISFIRIVPWRNTLKKGLGEQNDARVAGAGLDWYYNWGASLARGQAVTNREFVPMSWGHTGSYPAAITNYLAMSQVSTLLSFNEPDYPTEQSGQWGNLSIVSTAVVYHADLQKAGLRLGSPAPHEENAGGTNDWLTLFLNQTEAAGIRTDFVALHWYDWGNNPGVNTNPTPESVLGRLKSYLSNSYHLYRKPLWITEFNANPARAKPIHDAFIQMALSYLDSVGYVERYAYFQTPTDSGNFFDVNTNITTTGIIWRDHVSVPAYVPRGLPSPWLTADVGAVAQTGDVLHANGTYTVCGTGAGIAGTADEFNYVYQPLSGDITISAKINSMIWRHNDTIGGVMVRETLTSGSKHAMMALTSSNGAKFRRRTATGGSTADTTQAGITAPYWVKLVRTGSTLTGYHSTNGTAWTQSGTVTLAMSNTVYVGMAVSANNDGAFNDVIFTDVSVSTAPATYTITYDGNSNTGGTAPSPQTKTNDVALTLASNTGNLVRTGYTFAGWNTAANGLGTDYAAGASYTTNASATLYAKWTANTYGVTFSANGGGTPSPTNTLVTYGSTYGTLATVSRTGYTFSGWFTAPSGGTQITSGTTVAITSVQTLYAQWTANSYTVSFNANGGDTPSPASMSVTYDSTYGTLATVMRAGYTFNGWFTAASGGTQITSGTTVAITAAQTLYAQWTEDVKLPATVILSTLSQTYDGTARMVTYTTSPTGLAVSVTYDGSAVAPTNAGSYAVIGTVVSGIYEGITNGTLVVSLATPAVTNWPTAAPIILGQALSNATLTGGSASVSGSFNFVSPTHVPLAGATNAVVRFTPNDSFNYESVDGLVAVTVVDIYAVPFFEPFESREERGLDGQYGWSAEGTMVQTNKAFASVKAAQIGGGGFMKHTFSNKSTKVWTDMRVQVVQSPEKPKPDPDTTVAIYVWTNSIVYAFHGTNAFPTSITVQPGTNAWTRFTFFSDYAAKTYILYVNDVRAGKYGFYSSAVTNFTEIKVTGEATFVDDVGVTPNQPAMNYMPSLILLK